MANSAFTVAGISSNSSISVQIFTSGSGTYTKPANVTSIIVECVGGGGGGGGAQGAAGFLSVGGSGAGGGYCRKYYSAAASSYSYSVGTAGSGATAGNNAGTAGGDTTFDTLTAGGGGAGSGYPNNYAIASGYNVLNISGSPGVGTGGDINLYGGYAQPSIAGSVNVCIGGSGGSSMYGSGGIASIASGGAIANGNGGLDYGSGGSGGGACNITANAAGGAGASGLIIVWELVNSLSGVSAGTVTSIGSGGLITGGPITTSGTLTVTAATQTDQETTTSTTTAITPSVQQYHPSASKGWVQASTVGSFTLGYNVTSITDNATGIITVNWTNAFSTANYIVNCTPRFDTSATLATTLIPNVIDSSFAAGSCVIVMPRASDGAYVDPNFYLVSTFGDLP